MVCNVYEIKNYFLFFLPQQVTPYTQVNTVHLIFQFPLEVLKFIIFQRKFRKNGQMCDIYSFHYIYSHVLHPFFSIGKVRGTKYMRVFFMIFILLESYLEAHKEIIFEQMKIANKKNE